MIKISDIILLQSTIYGQCKGSWFNNRTGNLRVCGLGSISSYLKKPENSEIFGGFFVKDLAERHKQLEQEFPMLFKVMKRNGELALPLSFVSSYKTIPRNLAQAIVFMNDELDYSLEQIAEYVAKAERIHPEWYENADTENSTNSVEAKCAKESLTTA